MPNKNPNLKLTSINIHEDLRDNFQVDIVKTKFTLQKLVNRAMHMYLNDEEFKNKLLNYNILVDSGSL